MATYRVPVLGDFAWQPPISDRVTAPTEVETKGTRYIIIATATGIFTGLEGQIATAKQDSPTLAGDWYFDVPSEGWTARVLDEDVNYIHNGTAWVATPAGAVDADVSTNSTNISINSANISINASTNVVQDASIDSLEVVDSANLSTEVADVASIDIVTSVNASTNVVQGASIDSLEIVDSTNLSTEVADVASIDSAKQDAGVYVAAYGAIEFTL